MFRITCFIAMLLIPPITATASPQALNLKEVPDDARATIAKELARKNKQQAQEGAASEDGGGSNRGGAKGGCSMDVGSQKPSSPAQRRTITLVTGPIVQLCK